MGETTPHAPVLEFFNLKNLNSDLQLALHLSVAFSLNIYFCNYSCISPVNHFMFCFRFLWIP